MSQEAKILTGIGVVCAVILVAAVFIFSKSTPPASTQNDTPVDAKLLTKPDSHMTEATTSAKLTLVEFGDYQCPSCEAAYPVIKQAMQDYGSQLNFVFRNFPLPMHQNAQIAAEAAESAGAQGKYWQMHDALYDHQNDWADSKDPLPLFDQYAQQIGLNVNQFNTDVNSNKYADKISQDQNDGNSLGVNATPTLFLNNKTAFVGAPTYQDLKAKLDVALRK